MATYVYRRPPQPQRIAPLPVALWPVAGGGTQVDATVGTLTITGIDALVTSATLVNATVGTLTIAGIDATVITSTVTITTPSQYHTYQRDGSGQADIAIAGTYTGSPTAVEASFNGGAYATIDASPTGEAFSGTLSNQSSGRGTLTVRFTNATGTTDTVSDIGIGDVYLVGGDSVAVGQGTSQQSYSGAIKAAAFKADDSWIDGDDPITVGYTTGSQWPLLATHIMTHESVPVAFITCATGSTDIWDEASWAYNNGRYNIAVAQASDAAIGTTGAKAILMHLGPNASVAATAPTIAQYNTALDTMANGFASDITGSPPTLVNIMGEVATGSPPDRRTANDNIRAAIIEAWGDNSNIKPGPVLIDQDYADNVHPSTNAQLQAVADRWWAAIDEAFYSGPSGRGPRVSSITYDSDDTDITIVFDRNLDTDVSSYTIAAFRVEDDGTPVTVTAAARSGNTDVVLSLQSTPSGVITVSLGSENDASGATIPCSADVTLPSASTINLPAEPFADVSVGINVPATVGTLTIAGVNASVTAATLVNASVGTLTVSGIDASVTAATPINASVGTLTIAGIDAAITAGPTSTTVNATVGTLSIAGIDASVTAAGGSGTHPASKLGRLRVLPIASTRKAFTAKAYTPVIRDVLGNMTLLPITSMRRTFIAKSVPSPDAINIGQVRLALTKQTSMTVELEKITSMALSLGVES